MPKRSSWQRPISLGLVSFDRSDSARIRVFGSVAAYDVHYVRESTTPVGFQPCPKSISENNTCSFCSYPLKPDDSQVSTYKRYCCLAWDFNKEEWAVLDGTQGMFLEIKKLFNDRRFSKEDIVAGKTDDLILQKIGQKKIPELINESLGQTDNRIEGPPPFESLHHFMDKRAKTSIWYIHSYADAIRQAGNRQADLAFLAAMPPPRPPRPLRQDIEPIEPSAPLIYRRPSPLENNTAPKPKKHIKKDNFQPPIPKRNDDPWDII